MGGYGSGRDWYRKKITVESCRVLDVGSLQRAKVLRADRHSHGSWVWSDAETGEKTADISYEVNTINPTETAGNKCGIDGLKPFDADTNWIRLSYTFTESGETMKYRVGLITDPLPWGGVRWAFLCPNVHCGRVCRKLYLPNGGRYFACRLCYRLTYTSSQDAHRWDTLARSMGMTPTQLNAGLRA